MSTSVIMLLMVAVVVIIVLVAATQRSGPRVTEIDHTVRRNKDEPKDRGDA